MIEMLDVFNAFPAPLQGAWVLWLAWGAGLIVWYRRGRAPVAPALPPPRPRPRRVPKPVAPPEASDSTSPSPDAAAAAQPLPVDAAGA